MPVHKYHKNVVLNNGFRVDFGSRTFGFARVRNLSTALDVETIQEGGRNWSVHTLAKPLSSSQKLVLERGFLSEGEEEPDLRIGSRIKDLTIMVMQRGEIKKTYTIEEGIVTRWDLSDLDALQGQVIYNTIEIMHTGLREDKAK